MTGTLSGLKAFVFHHGRLPNLEARTLVAHGRPSRARPSAVLPAPAHRAGGTAEACMQLPLTSRTRVTGTTQSTPQHAEFDASHIAPTTIRRSPYSSIPPSPSARAARDEYGLLMDGHTVLTG